MLWGPFIPQSLQHLGPRSRWAAWERVGNGDRLGAVEASSSFCRSAAGGVVLEGERSEVSPAGVNSALPVPWGPTPVLSPAGTTRLLTPRPALS